MTQPSQPLQLEGHRAVKLGVGPFAATAPALVIAGVFAAAVTVVAVTGGRWQAVHLFTLGVATPLIVAFSQQFARAVTRSPRVAPLRELAAVTIGAVALAVALPAGSNAIAGIAATVITAGVLSSYVHLRRMRRGARDARFAWLVRLYERAHGAFVHGAVLGAVMGLGLVAGSWYGAIRLAHLHINLAGWVGLTVLGTVVFFGPAMLRTRLPDGAEESAASSLRAAATAITVAALALLLTGLAGGAGTIARLVAALALTVYAQGAVVVARLTLRAARAAHPSPARPLLVAATAWFCLAAAADIVVVAAAAWRWLDAIGVVFAAGVVVQLALAVALFLLPSLRGRGFAARDAMIARTERGAGVRAAALNAAVAAIAASAALRLASVIAVAAWAVVAVIVVHTAVLAVLPVHADPAVAKSRVARRYRPTEHADRR